MKRQNQMYYSTYSFISKHAAYITHSASEYGTLYCRLLYWQHFSVGMLFKFACFLSDLQSKRLNHKKSAHSANVWFFPPS